MNNNGTEEMKATTIAHLVGRMDIILKTIEHVVLEIEEDDYLAGFLKMQINQAKIVNDMIFEMHKKNELDKIKKSYDDGNE